MESHDRCPTDEITAVRTLLPPPPPPTPSVAGRAWSMLGQRIRGRSVLPRWRAVPSRRPALTRAAMTAVASGAAAAVAVTALALGGGQAPPAPVPGPAAALHGAPARPFLLAMATKAAGQKTARYYCQNAVQGDRQLVGKGDVILPGLWWNGPAHVPTSAPDGFRYALARRYRSVGCSKGTGVGWHATLDQFLGARPASPADTRAWRRDGSPDHWQDGHHILSAHPGRASAATYVKPGPGDFGLTNYSSLPGDPVKLRAFLLAHPLPAVTGRDNVLVEGSLAVMSDPVRPAVHAAALKVLASVPGLRMKPGVTDPEGQTVTAVWQDSWIGGDNLPYETHIVFIDPRTAAFTGSETFARTPVEGAAPGTVLEYDVDLSQGWTNHLPPGLKP